MRVFRKVGTTVNPVDPDQASMLVVEGPFTFSRNPWDRYVSMWSYTLKRKQLNFQTLITMAILGCFLLEAWFEALLISVLIALATNLETSAIRKAREAMQGGLDRLPRTARRVPKKIMSSFSISSAPRSMRERNSVVVLNCARACRWLNRIT